MALFKTIYFVWLFTVCNLIELSSSDNTIQDFIERAKKMNRGPYSGPFQLEQVSYDTLDEYEEHFHKELCCNYVVSATVHMHIIEKILVNSYNEIGEYPYKDRIEFTNQATQMLYVVFNINTNDSWHATVEVMWLLYMYTEMVHDIIWEPKYRQLTEKKWLKTHKVVVQIFEEYITSHDCEVFDPTTNKKVVDVIEVVNNLTSEATDLESLTKLVKDNKDQLNIQNEHNHNIDNRYDTGMWCKICLPTLLLSYWTKEPCYVENLHYFDIQLDMIPIKKQLKNHYRHVRNSNNLLYVRIEEIIAYQEKFLHLMKVIAIRISVRYLMNISRMSDTVLQDFVLNHAEYCNEKMIEHLNIFANHFDITDDQYIRPVIDLLVISAQTFVERSVIDGYLNILLNLLGDMSLDDMRFDTPMKVNDENSKQTIDSTNILIKEHHYIFLNGLSTTPVEIIELPVRESLISAEVFVTYATRYTALVDFKLMKSFRQFGNSEISKRLREL